MRPYLSILIGGCLAAAIPCRGQSGDEVEWVWDAPKADGAAAVADVNAFTTNAVEPAPEAAPAAAEPAPATSNAAPSAFDWNWQDVESVETGAVAQAGAAGLGGSVDVGAYNALIQENLELRQSIERVMREENTIRQEKDRLQKEAKELEQQVGELALIKGQGAGSVFDRQRKEWQDKVAAAEAENRKLQEEMHSMRRVLAAAPDATATNVAAAPLVQQLEGENIRLKEQMREMESKFRALEIMADERQKLARELAATKAESQSAGELAKRLPAMEKELDVLRAGLARRDKDLESTRAELDLRETRLAKSERMVSTLAKAKEEVKQVGEKEKRDMHYNMAGVYAREGRMRDAEQEYLRALQIDPNDSDSHYNLGILYDDEFKDVRRARVHYRRYLMLRPDSPDADTVKNWLIKLDIAPAAP